MTAPLESLWKATEERLKNPIVAAFAISWIIYNWRPIAFFLLSNKDVEQKVYMLSDQSSSFWYLFVFPLLSASAYVIAIPWINLYYDEAVFGAEKRKIYADAKKRGVRELADKNLKSENLIVQVDALNAERSIIIAKNTELEKELTKQKNANLAYQKENGSLTEQVLSLTLTNEIQVDELKDQIEKLMSQSSEAKNDYEKRIEGLLKGESDLRKQHEIALSQKQNLVNSAEMKINDLGDEIMNINREAREFKDLKEKEILRLNQDILQLKNAHAVEISKGKQYEDRINTLQFDIDQLNQTIIGNQDQYADEINQLQEKYTEANDLNQMLYSANDRVASEIYSLLSLKKGELVDARNRLDAFDHEFNETKSPFNYSKSILSQFFRDKQRDLDKLDAIAKMINLGTP